MKWILFLSGCLLVQLAAAQNPRQRAWEQALRTPIDFWGMVVDEGGKPVANATVTITVSNGSLQEDGTGVVLHTDAGGLFSLTGKTGLGIVVLVSKDGYFSTGDPSSAILNYFRRSSEHITSFRRGGINEPFPTKAKPTLFVLTK